MFEKTIRKVMLSVLNEDKNNVLQIKKLNEELENLKLKRKLEENEIAAYLTIERKKFDIEKDEATRSAKMDLEEQKKNAALALREEKIKVQEEKLKLQSEYKDKELALQKTYHEAAIAQLNDQAKLLDKTYTEIMKRLPNVNVQLGEALKKEKE